jgi:hypothetical protein
MKRLEWKTPFGSILRVRANAYDWTALDIDEVVPESANDLRFAARHAGKGSNFTCSPTAVWRRGRAFIATT